MFFAHPTLKAGSYCPECALVNSKGKLYSEPPKVVVKLEGQPLITGTRYTAECLRCGLCSMRYVTPWPQDIKNKPKYHVSVATSLAIGRYSMGLPLYRIEYHQAQQGIPLADATQWDLLRGLHQTAAPVHEVMMQHAAQGELVIYDDTPGRILSARAAGKTTHTTAFISVYEGHKIHLFLTGVNCAGKNTAEILEKRTRDEPIIAMMDASPSNIPKLMNSQLTVRFILCFCLTHGRRKFFEIFNFFEEQCDFVLGVIGQVYQHDEFCRKNKLSCGERLVYHQKHSQPLMNLLYRWLNNQLLYDLAENHSGFGQAITYMLRHWEPLTTFLRVAGAPLDSSWAERAIKIAIRHRRNSLFYKTPQGACVGDSLMSLIYTAQQNNVNPFDYLNALQRYATHVKTDPSQWLPWNYEQQRKRSTNPIF